MDGDESRGKFDRRPPQVPPTPGEVAAAQEAQDERGRERLRRLKEQREKEALERDRRARGRELRFGGDDDDDDDNNDDDDDDDKGAADTVFVPDARIRAALESGRFACVGFVSDVPAAAACFDEAYPLPSGRTWATARAEINTGCLAMCHKTGTPAQAAALADVKSRGAANAYEATLRSDWAAGWRPGPPRPDRPPPSPARAGSVACPATPHPGGYLWLPTHFRRADLPLTGRGDAAATWKFRGDESCRPPRRATRAFETGPRLRYEYAPYGLCWAEGLNGWRVLIARLLALAKNLNASLVLPCARHSVLVARAAGRQPPSRCLQDGLAGYPRRGRGVAATRLHGILMSRPRRRFVSTEY